MATVLARAVEAEVAAYAAVEFEDAGDIAAWDKGYVKTAVELELLTGYPDGTFRPQAMSTRAEASTVFWRVVDLLFR